LVKFVSLLIPCLEQTVLRSIVSKGIPILGAIGSAALNAGFCQYFSKAARYHFGLLHLEARYGRERIHEHYAGACHAESAWPEIRRTS
jgi:hypothetical protein